MARSYVGVILDGSGWGIRGTGLEVTSAVRRVVVVDDNNEDEFDVNKCVAVLHTTKSARKGDNLREISAYLFSGGALVVECSCFALFADDLSPSRTS